jgi:hypothetical protein
MFLNFNFKIHYDVNFSKKIEIIFKDMYHTVAGNIPTYRDTPLQMAATTSAIHTETFQNQYTDAGSHVNINIDGRRAFYQVTDVMQEIGIRDRRFDTIVLQSSAQTGVFMHYIVFRQNMPTPQPILPIATSIASAAAAAALYAISHRPEVPEVAPEHIRVDATIVLYNRATDRFYSDGAYHSHTFSPNSDSFVSVSDEHIANEKFKFYKQRV